MNAAFPPLPIDLSELDRTEVVNTPFPHLIVPNFVRDEATAPIGKDFPAIKHPGSFPLTSLEFGPAFGTFMTALRGPQMEASMERKFGVTLHGLPTTITVRGRCSAKEGAIHRDSKSKLITVLIYMNDQWESAKGRLRLLRSSKDLNDIVAEVPPARGTLLAFLNGPNAWHGFESFVGARRVIQLNWVTSERRAAREEARHRLSAFFKGLGTRR